MTAQHNLTFDNATITKMNVDFDAVNKSVSKQINANGELRPVSVVC